MVGSDVFPTELVAFLGNMLVFRGVIIAICGWLLFVGLIHVVLEACANKNLVEISFKNHHPLCVG